PLVEFLGEANDEQKQELIGNALALLFPIDWPEPFGLVMIESLACGTPVIGIRRGSVPEVIRDGVTGRVCDTEDELVEAAQRVAGIDRAQCRREFERRFTAARMARNYVKIYRQISARCDAPQTLQDHEAVAQSPVA